MTKINELQIKTKLNEIIFSDGSTMLGRASNIVHNKNDIGFSVDITSLNLSHSEEKRLEALDVLSKIEYIGKISIVLTSSKKEQAKSEGARNKIHIEGVKYVLAVAAGKGGVGKSTISALIAETLSLEGKKVGIVDADIYGPSIPQIFGLNNKPVLNDKKMIPLGAREGIVVNSIGFLTAPGSSISWRGPMVSKALYQLLSLTQWGNLDCLIIDLPPGTGDIHLSLLQNYIIDSVIMITTPQKISQIDVCRAIDLYKKFNINILGIIENMSYLIDSVTGEEKFLFSGNSGQEIANIYNIPLLAKFPFDTRLAEACDKGESLINYSHHMMKITCKITI